MSNLCAIYEKRVILQTKNMYLIRKLRVTMIETEIPNDR